MTEKKKEDICSEVLSSAQEEKLAEQKIYQETLEEKNKQINQYHDQLLRLKAEFENFRKRVDREKQECLRWGKEDIVIQLISFLDVFEQAHKQALSAENIESIIKGLELICKEFEKFLKKEGITAISTENKKFDPLLHEAVGFVEIESGNDHEIVEELQKGYCLNNRMIRPAKVKVTRLKSQKNESSDTDKASKDQQMS